MWYHIDSIRSRHINIQIKRKHFPLYKLVPSVLVVYCVYECIWMEDGIKLKKKNIRQNLSKWIQTIEIIYTCYNRSNYILNVVRYFSYFELKHFIVLSILYYMFYLFFATCVVQIQRGYNWFLFFISYYFFFDFKLQTHRRHHHLVQLHHRHRRPHCSQQKIYVLSVDVHWLVCFHLF